MRVLRRCRSAFHADSAHVQIGPKNCTASERRVTGCVARKLGKAACSASAVPRGFAFQAGIRGSPTENLAPARPPPYQMKYRPCGTGAEEAMKIEDSIRRKTGNRLLAAMPAGVWEDLKPHLELVELASGHVLCTSGKPLKEIHFPLTGTIVGVLVILRDGPAAEATIIGREGVVGGIVTGPGHPSFIRAIAQVPGWSARIAATR